MEKCLITRYACCPRCKLELSEDVEPEYAFHWWRCEACHFVWRVDLDAEPAERPAEEEGERRLVDV